MAQTDPTNFSEVPPSSGGNAPANCGSASVAPSSALTVASGEGDPFVTGAFIVRRFYKTSLIYH